MLKRNLKKMKQNKNIKIKRSVFLYFLNCKIIENIKRKTAIFVHSFKNEPKNVTRAKREKDKYIK